MLLLYFLKLSLTQSIDLTSGSIEGYFSLSEISSVLSNYCKTHPNLELISIGKTLNNREISGLRLPNPQRPRMLVIGGHHARELISMSQVFYILDHILTSLKLNKEIWFIPVLNVDGLAGISEEYSKTRKILEIRKNLHPSSCPKEKMGIDLNRNYGYQWGYDNTGSSSNPCDEEYRGEFAFSEKETQAIKNLTEKYKFDSVISYHSYGNMYIRPTGFKESPMSELPLAHQEVYKELKSILPQSFRFGSVNDLLHYKVNGSFMDYLYSLGIFSIEIEISPESLNTFHPNIVQLPSILKPHLEPFDLIFNRTSSYLHIDVKNFGRKLMIKVENTGLATEYSKEIVLNVVNKKFKYKVLSAHLNKVVDGMVYVTLGNIPSGGEDLVEVMVYCDVHEVNVSVHFWPAGEREQNFYGELKLKVKQSSYIAKVVVFVVIFVVLLIFVLAGCVCYRLRDFDKVEFMEMVDIMPSGSI